MLTPWKESYDQPRQHIPFSLDNSTSIKLEKWGVSSQGLISWVVLIQAVNYGSEAFCKYLCTLIRDFPSENLSGADSQWYLRGPSASSLEHQDFWVLHSWRLRCSTLHEDGLGPGVWPQGNYWVSWGPQCCCLCVTSSGRKYGWRKCVKTPCFSQCGCLPSWVLPVIVGSRGLSVSHGEVFPVCVVGAQEGNVLIVNIKQHFFNLHDRPLKTDDTWGKSSKDEEEERKVRDGFFSGKVTLWIYFHLLKCPSLC